MHPDDLKTMWLCYECGRKFVFHSDVEYHERHFNHSKKTLCYLACGRKATALFSRRMILLGFRLDGRAPRIIVE